MRGVREKAPQTLLALLAFCEGLFNLSEHRVQGKAEPPHLGALVGGADAARQVACGDCPSGRTDPIEWPQAEPDNEPGKNRQSDKHRSDDDRLDLL